MEPRAKAFVSDLDGTLIFSSRELGADAIKLEEGAGIERSSLEALAQISDLARFIPATSRSVAQYQRLRLEENGIKVFAAVVANGAVVMKDGKRDEAYAADVANDIENSRSLIEELVRSFEEGLPSGAVKRKRLVDGSFYLFNVDFPQNSEVEVRRSIEELLPGDGPCSWSLQGSKLYIIPKCISKERAVSHIARKFGLEIAAAAGDSSLDLGILTIARSAFALAGEINEKRSAFPKRIKEVPREKLLEEVFREIR